MHFQTLPANVLVEMTFWCSESDFFFTFFFAGLACSAASAVAHTLWHQPIRRIQCGAQRRSATWLPFRFRCKHTTHVDFCQAGNKSKNTENRKSVVYLLLKVEYKCPLISEICTYDVLVSTVCGEQVQWTTRVEEFRTNRFSLVCGLHASCSSSVIVTVTFFTPHSLTQHLSTSSPGNYDWLTMETRTLNDRHVEWHDTRKRQRNAKSSKATHSVKEKVTKQGVVK